MNKNNEVRDAPLWRFNKAPFDQIIKMLSLSFMLGIKSICQTKIKSIMEHLQRIDINGPQRSAIVSCDLSSKKKPSGFHTCSQPDLIWLR